MPILMHYLYLKVYCAFRKRQSTSSTSPHFGHSVSKFSGAGLLYEGNNIQKRPNAAILIEEIKQEAENYDLDLLEQTASETKYLSKRQGLGSELNGDYNLAHSNHPPKSLKQEYDMLVDCGETTFTLFASLLESALQGLDVSSNLF
ncbi:hypothetical protein KSP40_PGU001805 [Platanthera guangdongensis]|uniref:Uncharacterized protein n=1 Tax=Platanthera guangdongensis TaxID=2320717 RepID=A0ABR2MPI7_9ASPA